MTNLVEITQEYVELKGINPKPVFIALDRLAEVCGSKAVEEYTRQDARVFVDSYKDVSRLGKVTTTSVRRRLNSLNAVFNYAIYELDLPHRNPFSRIIIKGEGKDAIPREPFSVVELKKLYSASLAYGQLRLILPILGETGCRLSEVLGLMKEDVVWEEDFLIMKFVPVPGHWGTLPLSMKGAQNGTTETELHRRVQSGGSRAALRARSDPRQRSKGTWDYWDATEDVAFGN
jgi:hypothetical protein